MNVPVLTDHSIADAIREQAQIILAKVQNLTESRIGTRGHQTTYNLDSIRTVLGNIQEKLSASHYGGPRMATGKVYAISLKSSQRFGQQILTTLEIPPAQLDDSIKAHVVAISRLRKAVS